MSVLTAEPAPPIIIEPDIPILEEYGIDASIAYSVACTDVIRAARRVPENSTLALAGLLVSTEVEIARVHQDMKQPTGINLAVTQRKLEFIEQYPGMFVTERGIDQSNADLAVSLAIGAILAIRSQPDAPFDLRGYLEQSYELEISAQNT